MPSTPQNNQVGLIYNRPYGKVCIIAKQPGLKIDHVFIDPHNETKNHKHQFRHEHWVVLEGKVVAVVNNQEFHLKTHEYIDIPPGNFHYLKNPTDSQAVVVKVQSGDYLEEDDSQIPETNLKSLSIKV